MQPLVASRYRPLVVALAATLCFAGAGNAPAATQKGSGACVSGAAKQSAAGAHASWCAALRKARAARVARKRAIARKKAAAIRAAGRVSARRRKPTAPRPVVLAPLPTTTTPKPTTTTTATTTTATPPTTPTTLPPTTPPPTTPPPTTPPPTTPPPTTPATSGPVYWGAWIGSHLTGTEAPWDLNAISSFEQHAGKKLTLVNFSSPFAACWSSPCTNYNFPAGEFTAIRNRGAIPSFSWGSGSLPLDGNQSAYQLSDVIAGRHDTYITAWATAAKNWGHPFFLRFNWEMNGNWMMWSEGLNGNQTGEYVAAWRHVHDIFTRVGATNATWVWCPNIDPYHSWQSLASLYPGDNYVDWTGLDGYNFNAPWTSFADLFRSSYQEITTTIAPSKPVMVAETASTETGGSKPAWISAMFASLENEFPKVRALQWFDKIDNGDTNWPIESSAGAISAFAAGIGSPRYKATTAGLSDGLTKVAVPTQ